MAANIRGSLSKDQIAKLNKYIADSKKSFGQTLTNEQAVNLLGNSLFENNNAPPAGKSGAAGGVGPSKPAGKAGAGRAAAAAADPCAGQPQLNSLEELLAWIAEQPEARPAEHDTFDEKPKVYDPMSFYVDPAEWTQGFRGQRRLPVWLREIPQDGVPAGLRYKEGVNDGVLAAYQEETGLANYGEIYNSGGGKNDCLIISLLGGISEIYRGLTDDQRYAIADRLRRQVLPCQDSFGVVPMTQEDIELLQSTRVLLDSFVTRLAEKFGVAILSIESIKYDPQSPERAPMPPSVFIVGDRNPNGIIIFNHDNGHFQTLFRRGGGGAANPNTFVFNSDELLALQKSFIEGSPYQFSGMGAVAQQGLPHGSEVRVVGRGDTQFWIKSRHTEYHFFPDGTRAEILLGYTLSPTPELSQIQGTHATDVSFSKEFVFRVGEAPPAADRPAGPTLFEARRQRQIQNILHPERANRLKRAEYERAVSLAVELSEGNYDRYLEAIPLAIDRCLSPPEGRAEAAARECLKAAPAARVAPAPKAATPAPKAATAAPPATPEPKAAPAAADPYAAERKKMNGTFRTQLSAKKGMPQTQIDKIVQTRLNTWNKGRPERKKEKIKDHIIALLPESAFSPILKDHFTYIDFSKMSVAERNEALSTLSRKVNEALKEKNPRAAEVNLLEIYNQTAGGRTRRKSHTKRKSKTTRRHKRR